jgi:hypothetical protein
MNDYAEDEVVGRRRWAITEGYLAAPGDDPEHLGSLHETLFLLNAGELPVTVDLSLYFSDREPLGPYRFAVAGQRTRLISLQELDGPEIPRGREFVSLIESDRPIVVLATRRRAPHPDDAPLSKIAFSG